MDVFGRRWENYVQKLTEGWLKTVTDGDTVVIPGDISWGMTLDEALDDLLFLDKLPGRKIVGRGNHDYWWSTVRKMKAFLDEHSVKTVDFLYNNAFPVGKIAVCGSRGWWNDPKISPVETDYAKIINREVIRLEMSLTEAERLDAEPVVFLHFPPVWRDIVCREIVDLLHAHHVMQCYYGHLHMAYDVPASFDFEGITFTIVSSDYLNFVPIPVLEAEVR